MHRLVNIIRLVFSLRLSLLKQGLSEPDFVGDFVYKFKNILGRKTILIS